MSAQFSFGNVAAQRSFGNVAAQFSFGNVAAQFSFGNLQLSSVSGMSVQSCSVYHKEES